MLFQKSVPEQIYDFESESEVSNAGGEEKARGEGEVKEDLEKAGV
jgi:hypothetical protein